MNQKGDKNTGSYRDTFCPPGDDPAPGAILHSRAQAEADAAAPQWKKQRRGEQQSGPPGFEDDMAKGTLADKLYAAKHVTWRGPGELFQPPWNVDDFGLLVVVDLWDGISTTLLTLMMLGVRVIAVAAEKDQDVTDVASSCFPNVVHVDTVEEIQAADLQPLLQRRRCLPF